jgi:hypothetical protein
MPSVEPFVARTHIAYFSMEIAVQPDIHTYAAGWAFLPVIPHGPAPILSFPSSL